MGSKNCKVHFAGYDNDNRALLTLKAVGINYRLFTCYPFIKGKTSDQDMTVQNLLESKVPFNHTILDSGLFTLMFGAQAGKALTESDIREWMHRIVRFVKDNRLNASVVECDCQKIISPDFAWQLRREMRELLPKHEVINVFHLEDGEDGFRRMVDFAKYIAISVPELRIHRGKTYKQATTGLVKAAKKQKPDIKIHLLGCTEKDLLTANRKVTSADSSSWTASVRFGYLNKRHISDIRTDAALLAFDRIDQMSAAYGIALSEKTEKAKRYMAANYYTALKCKQDYTNWCGPQD